jgi:CBS domain-containing protein
MKVSEVLKAKGDRVVTVSPEETLAGALETLTREHIGALIVCDQDEKVLGVLSERDIVYGLAKHGAPILSKPVKDVMTSDVNACSPQDTMFRAMSMMTGRRVRHLPILDDGKLSGIISIGDAVKARIEEIEAEAKALREYINSA